MRSRVLHVRGTGGIDFKQTPSQSSLRPFAVRPRPVWQGSCPGCSGSSWLLHVPITTNIAYFLEMAYLIGISHPVVSADVYCILSSF